MYGVDVEQKENAFLSPDTETELKKTDVDNVYVDTFNRMQYYALEDGRLVKLASPINGLPLTKREDGKYESQHQIYALDEERAKIMPQFIPDDTLEPAHIEGDYIIGDTTGRRFPIDKYGNVVLPFDPIEIDPNASREEMTAYFEERKKRQLEATQEEIDEQIRKDAQYNEEQLERINKEMNDKLSSDIRKAREELDAIESRIKEGRILEPDFNRLLDIAGFGEYERKALTELFTLDNRIIHNPQPTQGEVVQNDGRQIG